MSKVHVLCLLANASHLINGVAFKDHADGGVVTVDPVDADVAENFAAIPGYSIVGSKPAKPAAAADGAAGKKGKRGAKAEEPAPPPPAETVAGAGEDAEAGAGEDLVSGEFTGAGAGEDTAPGEGGGEEF